MLKSRIITTVSIKAGSTKCTENLEKWKKYNGMLKKIIFRLCNESKHDNELLMQGLTLVDFHRNEMGLSFDIVRNEWHIISLRLEGKSSTRSRLD